jgi:hypothetical protein
VQQVSFPDFVDGGSDGEEEEVMQLRHRTVRRPSRVNNVGNPMKALDSMINPASPASTPASSSSQVPVEEFEALVLAEDYGQGIAMPHYGITRPKSDYFNSNLNVNLYVQADISRNENRVTLYDERTMGKDKDAL